MASSPDSLLCRGGVGGGVAAKEMALYAPHCGTCLSRVRGGHIFLDAVVSRQHTVKCRKCAVCWWEVWEVCWYEMWEVVCCVGGVLCPHGPSHGAACWATPFCPFDV